MRPPGIVSRWNTLLDRWRERMVVDRSHKPHQARPHRKGVAIAVCILISFLLWFTFNMRDTYTVAVEMPTRVVNVPAGQALESLPPQSVRVQVFGEGWQLLQLYYNPQTIPIDAGQRRIDLMETMPVLPRLPTGVAVQSISPRIIEVDLGTVVSRMVPVELRATIDPAQSYDLVAPPVVRPDSVRITGAASIINQFISWPTEHLVRENARASFTAVVPLSDSLQALVSKDIQEVIVSTELELFTEGTRQVDVRIADVPPGDTRVRLMPEQVTVRFQVPMSQYELAQTAEEMFAIVSFDDIREDQTGMVNPILEVPPNLIVRNVTFEPRQLRYTLIVPAQ